MEKKLAMQVNFYATLRQIVGRKTVEILSAEGGTLRELVKAIVRAYPAMEREMLDDQGDLYSHIHIFVNGRDASFLENSLDEVLSSADRVDIFPAVGGG